MNPQNTPPLRSPPFREDCWTEDATSTLVDSWGRRYLDLNRGNLRQKDWQDVADAVNNLHGHTKKTRRTDVQCKNRIDTLKKKYKVEKAKIVESNGTLTSTWPFFSRLEGLIGSNYDKFAVAPTPTPTPTPRLAITPLGFGNSQGFDSSSPPMAVPLPYRKLALPPPPAAMLQTPPQIGGVKRMGGAMEGPQKRMNYEGMTMLMQEKRVMEGDFRRNYSAMAAAAAKEEEEEEEEGEEEELEEEGEEEGEEQGMRKLAKAIERFGEIYERVEEMKQRQMVELEKQRMQFTKDLEVQRMQLFMDTQVQLEKIKQAKQQSGGGSDGIEFDISQVFQQFNQFVCNFM